MLGKTVSKYGYFVFVMQSSVLQLFLVMFLPNFNFSMLCLLLFADVLSLLDDLHI